MSKTLAERLQFVQGHQRKMLSDQKDRLAAQQAPKSQDGDQNLADGQEESPKAKPVIEERGQIDAGMLFERLLVPVTSHMACSPEDVEWIRANWGAGDDLVPTLLDWAAKVMLEGVSVDEEIRTATAILHKQGSACLKRPSPPAPNPTKEAPSTAGSVSAQMSRGAMRP